MHKTLYWKQIRTTCHAFIALSMALIASQASAINKCELNGNVTYTDQPCPQNAQIQPFSQQVIAPDDPAAAKQRYLADKKKLGEINKQKTLEEKQLQRDAQTYAHQKKLAQDRELKCKNLDLKRQTANQNLKDAKHTGNTGKIKKSQAQMQQAENNYTRTCSTE